MHPRRCRRRWGSSARNAALRWEEGLAWKTCETNRVGHLQVESENAQRGYVSKATPRRCEGQEVKRMTAMDRSPGCGTLPRG